MAYVTPADLARAPSRARRRVLASGATMAAIRLVSLLVIVGILALIGTIIVRGAGAISWEFLTAPPDEGMSSGGIGPMIRGTMLLMLGSLVLVLPIGIGAGIFLAEYAGRGRWVHVARALITSLAGTPSIVFGLFGLAIFVLMLKMGASLQAGVMTLALMAMPVIVLNTEQAIRGVPDPMIEAGIALGLTRWQVMWRVVLPNALPGIMTGIVLATGRAAGEAPPILLTAGIWYTTQTGGLGLDTLREPVMNLPYHLAESYRQPKVVPESIVWGTCLVLMALILVLNLGAILIRARARRKLAP